MKQLFYAVAFILLAVSGSAVSQDEPTKNLNGVVLLGYCKASINATGPNPEIPSLSGAAEAGYCLGAINTFSWINVILMVADAAFFCPPDGLGVMPNEQLERIYVNYLEGHPEELHQNYIILMAGAFGEAFPCDVKE